MAGASGWQSLGDVLGGGGTMAQLQGMMMGARYQDMGAMAQSALSQIPKNNAQTAQALEAARLARQKYGANATTLATSNQDLMDPNKAPLGPMIVAGLGSSYNAAVQGRDRAFASNPQNMNSPAYTAALAGITGKPPGPVNVGSQFVLPPGIAPPLVHMTPAGQAATNEANARTAWLKGGGRVAGYEPDPNNPGHLMPIPGGPHDSSATDQALGSPTATGDAYLQSIPDMGVRQLVKAIAEGREQVPRIYRAGNGASIGPTQIAAAVAQYDPTFNQQDFNSRNRMRIDATSGQMAANMRALNQAAAHLGQLETQVGGTAGHAFPFVGGLINRAENAAIDPYTSAVTRYQGTVDAVAHEVRALFGGSGGGTLQELEGYLGQLSPNNSVAQKQGAIQNLASLISSRIGILQQQYQQGMGKAGDPFSVAFPQAAATLQALSQMGRSPATATAPASTSPASTGRAPSAAPAPPAAHAPAPVRISSDAEWNALSPGTLFMGPDGHIRRK